MSEKFPSYVLKWNEFPRSFKVREQCSLNSEATRVQGCHECQNEEAKYE